jgi:serine/threonine-protein kinase HipA
MLAVIHSRGMVGTLQQSAGVLQFTYHPLWLGQEHVFPLSPRLALRSQPWSGDEVAFFFANLLPEGPVLDTLVQLRRLPRGNLYRLLEAFGRECAGAFAIVAEDEVDQSRPVAGYREYPRQQLVEDLQRLRENIPLLWTHAELRLSLAGAQNKIPVRYADGKLWLPEGNAASTHILKPALQPDRLFPDSIGNEAFCLELSAELGVPTPKVIVLSDPEPMLLIERYDRIVTGERVERLHQLDLCQLAGALPTQKYEADGGPGFRGCFEQIDACSAAPAVDRLRLVDWMLINYLIGNADAHAKNLCMLYAADGKLRLAPAYDLLATGYWEQLADKMAMRIGGERRPDFVHARHWRKFCDEVGLNPAQMRHRALDLSTRARARVDEVGKKLAVNVRLAMHFASTLEQRAGWFDRRLAAAE